MLGPFTQQADLLWTLVAASSGAAPAPAGGHVMALSGGSRGGGAAGRTGEGERERCQAAQCGSETMLCQRRVNAGCRKARLCSAKQSDAAHLCR